MRKATISATLALTTALFASDAAAQQPVTCADRPEIIKRLAGTYHEHPVAVGLMADGRLLEIFATSDGATWTVLTTDATGVSCVAAVGSDWLMLEPLSTKGKRA